MIKIIQCNGMNLNSRQVRTLFFTSPERMSDWPFDTVVCAYTSVASLVTPCVARACPSTAGRLIMISGMMMMMVVIMVITTIMVFIILAILMVLMMLLVSDDVFWQTQGFWIVNSVMLIWYQRKLLPCLFCALPGSDCQRKRPAKSLWNCRTSWATGQQLVCRFTDPNVMISFDLTGPSSYSEGEAIPHLTKNSGWVNSCPMNKPDQYVKCGERVA